MDPFVLQLSTFVARTSPMDASLSCARGQILLAEHSAYVAGMRQLSASVPKLFGRAVTHVAESAKR